MNPKIYSQENVVDWKNIVKYYTTKKREWAIKKTYYSGHSDWGSVKMPGTDETYGYELKPPYSEEEIVAYQQTCNIKLPRELEQYLTTVSRELFLGLYPMIFSINRKVPYGNFRVPVGKSMWMYGDCIEHQGNEDCDCRDPTSDGLVLIAQNGCTDQDYLIVKGNHLNTIWSKCDGGDSMATHYRFKTFLEYLISPIMSARENTAGKERPKMTEEMMMHIYKILRLMSGQHRLHYSN